MTPETFVRNLRAGAEATAVTSVLAMLRKPAGRGPRHRHVELSHWFNGLSEADQAMVADAVAAAAEQATYNVLLVLDGMLAIESTREKGRLKLLHVSGDDATLLNDEEAEPLTAFFRMDPEDAT